MQIYGVKYMQKWTDTVPLDKNNHLLLQVFTEEALFFDIETTGFSPASTQVYLIGCAKRCDDNVIIEQYFAETPDEEKMILSAFLRLLENYRTLITFNGIGFDIPYLKAKCDTYHLCESFAEKDYIDLFKIVSDLKFLLKLPNYKQKTIETFLGIDREDIFDGGQLINVYQEYVRKPSEYQMYFLKQHNYEDVLGMLDLLPIMSYANFLKGGYTILSVESNVYKDYDGHSQKELIFSLENDIPVPKRVSYGYDNFYLICNGTDTRLSVKLYDGTLKYFFENYKDYFYLPDEDIAIHKDVAASVDKAYRKKATASTCYTKKTSIFLPQYQEIVEPSFHKERKDNVSYFELSDEFIDSSQMLHKYVDHILKQMTRQKK